MSGAPKANFSITMISDTRGIKWGCWGLSSRPKAMTDKNCFQRKTYSYINFIL